MQFVQQIVNVLAINCVCKACVNPRVMIIQVVPISNSVKTTFVRKKFVVVATMSARSAKTVSSIHWAVQIVEMCVKVVFFVDAMLNVLPGVMMHFAHVNLASLATLKVDAFKLNAKLIQNVHRIVCAIKICAFQCVKLENHVENEHFVHQKIIAPYAIVNQDSAAIHMHNAKLSIIVVTHLAVLALNVPTIKEHSIAHVLQATSATHTMKAVVQRSNVKQTTIVRPVLNVSNCLANQNVEMFAKELRVDQMPIVFQLHTRLNVIVALVTAEKLLMFKSAVDHCQFHAHIRQNVSQILIVMLEHVSRRVASIKSALWKKFA